LERTSPNQIYNLLIESLECIIIRKNIYIICLA
jgi:hypothetical protein